MGYILMMLSVFFTDAGIKHYIDKNYARRVRHPRLGSRIIIEKYYNEGAALNFLSKKPGIMKAIHTALILIIGVLYYFLMRIQGKNLQKAGVALVLGGGLSNLLDRYTKGHVVDYFRINAGPKRLRNIIFNSSDFCIFIGALLAVIGADEMPLE